MLREFREKAGISQEKLEEITNIDRKTIHRIESDKNSPLVENYAKIVVALKMTDQQIANHIRKIATDNKKLKENHCPYDEKDCIYYISNEFCEKENITCGICRDKTILKEGETIEITEKYTLTRKNGKIIKE